MHKRSPFPLLALSFLFGTMMAVSSAFAQNDGSLLQQLNTISPVSSTIPGNGDVNPYGVVKVLKTTGKLTRGHILVSNFNNSMNQQGTGTTIVDISPSGTQTLFAQINAGSLPGECPGGVGLTTALAVLRSGWVIVGSLPTSDGTSATIQRGCLIVLDKNGNPVETFFGTLINGPWDMTWWENGRDVKLFVSNVLNGVKNNGMVVRQGSVVRIDLTATASAMPSVNGMTVVASGFPERTDPAALIIGPTGLALSNPCDVEDTDDCPAVANTEGAQALYVADTLGNRIVTVSNPLFRTDSAGVGDPFSAGGSLNGPLGLTVDSFGHVFAVNSNNGFITEINPQRVQVAKKLLNSTGSPKGAGALFGLVFDPDVNGIYFVDDDENALNLLH